MAKIVQGYDPYTTNSEMFSRMSDDSRVMEGLSEKFGSGISKTIERMAKMQSQVKNSKTYRRSLSAVRKVRNLRREDTILELHRVDQMQHAPRYMQEYLMGDSEFLAGRFNRGGIHAWESGYASRNKVANASISNPWNRELNDGLVRKLDDGFTHTQFADRATLRELAMDQKIDIKLSVQHLEDAVLTGGEDWCSENCEII